MNSLFQRFPIITDILNSFEPVCFDVVDNSFKGVATPLKEMLLYHMGWGTQSAGQKGKRIRPLLCLLTNHLTGGKWQDALPAAISLELIHNFSLIHDDIQDQSPTRHGRDTLWRTIGIPQAINAGDAIFSLALNNIWKLTSSFPVGKVAECSQILTSTCLKLTEGQFLDINFEKRSRVQVNEYQTMIEGKTASLLAACTHIGALLGSSDRHQIDAFKEYGYYLGLAFQVIDDYLGIWGNTGATGKSSESDLIAKKMSFPVVLAMEQDREFAARWNSGKITPVDIPPILEMLDRVGIAGQTRVKADEYTQKALESLRSACGNYPDFNILYDLTGWLLKREL